MMPSTAEQEARVGFRTTARQKAQVERAAQLRGLKPTAFMREILNKAAQETIQEYATMALVEEDREAFVAALLNPPEPNAYLRESVEIDKRLLGGD